MFEVVWLSEARSLAKVRSMWLQGRERRCCESQVCGTAGSRVDSAMMSLLGLPRTLVGIGSQLKTRKNPGTSDCSTTNRRAHCFCFRQLGIVQASQGLLFETVHRTERVERRSAGTETCSKALSSDVWTQSKVQERCTTPVMWATSTRPTVTTSLWKHLWMGLGKVRNNAAWTIFLDKEACRRGSRAEDSDTLGGTQTLLHVVC